MTRCIYLTFFGEPRGHAADPAPPAPRVGPPHRRAALHPRRPGRRGRLRQPARRRHLARRHGAALRALRRAHRQPLLPRRASTPSPTREFTLWIAVASTAIAVVGDRPRLRLLLAGPVPRHHRAQQGGPGRPHAAREQVLLRPPLHRRHRRRHQGPGRQGGLLVQPERARRHRQRRRRRRRPQRPTGPTSTSTRASSTAPSTARARRPTASARRCVSCRPARSSSTAPCSSAAPSCSPASSSSPSRRATRQPWKHSSTTGA